MKELAVLPLVARVLTGDAMFRCRLGWLADRVGIRRVHLSSAVVSACRCWPTATRMLGSRIQLMAICLLLGAAAGALYTTVSRWCEERGRALMGRC